MEKRPEKVTIYARRVDQDTWQWARSKAEADRDSLSRVVVAALRLYRSQCEMSRPDDATLKRSSTTTDPQ